MKKLVFAFLIFMIAASVPVQLNAQTTEELQEQIEKLNQRIPWTMFTAPPA